MPIHTTHIIKILRVPPVLRVGTGPEKMWGKQAFSYTSGERIICTNSLETIWQYISKFNSHVR